MLMRALVVVTALFALAANRVPASADEVAARASTYAAISHGYLGFTPPVMLRGAAPGDEYFGPLKMSVFGIRNTLKDAAARVDAHGVDRVDRLQSIALVELSIREWEKKYPHDTWLPRSVLALRTVYHQLAASGADWKSADTTSWLIAKYGSTAEAQTLRATLRRETAAQRAIVAEH